MWSERAGVVWQGVQQLLPAEYLCSPVVPNPVEYSYSNIRGDAQIYELGWTSRC